MEEMDQLNIETKNEKDKTSVALEIRYMSVGIITIILFAAMLFSIFNIADGLLCIIVIVMNVFISIPLALCWLYSFICSLFGRSDNDRILLILHFADLLLIGVTVLIISMK